MRRRTKRPSAALVVACIALFAALAGNGYGAVTNFLVGTTNTAAAKTTLSARIADKTLQLTNRSTRRGATTLGLTVAAGHAPFTTNSAKKVRWLNADMVDGYHAASFARLAANSRLDFFPLATYGTQATVTINVPKTGFVLLQGAATATTSDATCNPCYAQLRFHNATAAADSPTQIASIGDGSSAFHDTVLANTYVWPVTTGTHTFTMDAGVYPGGSPVSIYDPTFTALFVPFSATGKSVAPVPAAVVKPAGLVRTASGASVAP